MRQPLLPRCVSWSTFTGSIDFSSSCTASRPSATGDPEENSLAQAVSAAINSSLKAGGEAAPLQSCCARTTRAVSQDSGEKGGCPDGGRGSVWGWMDAQGKVGSRKTASISHTLDAWIRSGMALGGRYSPSESFWEGDEVH